MFRVPQHHFRDRETKAQKVEDRGHVGRQQQGQATARAPGTQSQFSCTCKMFHSPPPAKKSQFFLELSLNSSIITFNY